jgi:hypothetical protein
MSLKRKRREEVKGPSWAALRSAAAKTARTRGDGTNPKDAIASNKPPLALVPTGLLIPLSRVMELGAKKYGLWNWRATKVRYSVYIHAAIRHILSAMDGEDLDPESGQPHIAHAAACVAILLDAASVGTLVDDRVKGAAARLIVEATKK